MTITTEGGRSCSSGHPVGDDDAFCGLCGDPVSDVASVNPPTHCRAGHILPGEVAFCPECGMPVLPPLASGGNSTRGTGKQPSASRDKAINRPTPNPPPGGRLQFPSSTLRSFPARTFSLPRSLATLTGLLGLIQALLLLIYVPRLFFWTTATLVTTYALARVRKVDWFCLGALVGTGVATNLLGGLLLGTVLHAHGYIGSHTLSVWSLLGSVGSVGLAVLVCTYGNVEMRKECRELLGTAGAYSPVAVAMAVVLVLTGAIPIIRSLTGGFSFGLYKSVASINRFPGYLTPAAVAIDMRRRFTSQLDPGTKIDTLTCEYFAPGLPAPPVYDCSAKLVAQDGTVAYHDNIQAVGRPDKTYQCEDDTSGYQDARLC